MTKLHIYIYIFIYVYISRYVGNPLKEKILWERMYLKQKKPKQCTRFFVQEVL